MRLRRDRTSCTCGRPTCGTHPERRRPAAAPPRYGSSAETVKTSMSKFWSLFSRQSPRAVSRPGEEPEKGAHAAGGLEDQVIAIIRRECPAFSPADMQTPFERLGIDSVGMLMIHTSVEEATDKVFDSRQWDAIVTPADLVKTLRAATAGARHDAPATATERRHCQLNMPQMALGGLSEFWLFKELG